MRRNLIASLALFVSFTSAIAQTPPADPQVALTLIAEIRGLRAELQTTAATIQRVQIVMYRLQSQMNLFERVTQRVEQARAVCNQAQLQHKMMLSQIEQAEARRRSAGNPAEQKSIEEMIASMKLSIELASTEEQQCQVERTEAEAQYRAEQAKTAELQEQLEKLDRQLASVGTKQASSRD